MYELYTDMSWQHQVLFVWLVLDLFIGIWLTTRPFRRGPVTIVVMTLWNVAQMALLVTGADHLSWQYVTLAVYLLIDTASVIHNGLRRKVTDSNDFDLGAILFGSLMMGALLLMLVTGN